jgi:hypothetical protein
MKTQIGFSCGPLNTQDKKKKHWQKQQNKTKKKKYKQKKLEINEQTYAHNKLEFIFPSSKEEKKNWTPGMGQPIKKWASV